MTSEVTPMTLDEAMALPRPNKKPQEGVCQPGVGYEGRTFDHHNLINLPLPKPSNTWARVYDRKTAEAHYREEVERYERWRNIRDGRTCRLCYAVFDPTPLCQQRVYEHYSSGHRRCGAVARYTEVGSTEPGAAWSPRGEFEEHAKATRTHNYCGNHAPSRLRARAANQKAKREAEAEARRIAAAPGVERDAARAALLVEAVRWRDDEAATTDEPFCEDECEHHECRLARAVARYEAAMEALRQRQARRWEVPVEEVEDEDI